MNRKAIAAMAEHAINIRVAALGMWPDDPSQAKLIAAYEFLMGLIGDDAVARGRQSMRREMKKDAALFAAVSAAAVSSKRARRAIEKARQSIAEVSIALERHARGEGAP